MARDFGDAMRVEARELTSTEIPLNGERRWTVSDFGAALWLPAIKAQKSSWRVDERVFRQYLMPVMGTSSLNELDYGDVKKLQDFLVSKDLSPATQNRILYVLKSLLGHAINYDILSDTKLVMLKDFFFRHVNKKDDALLTPCKMGELYKKLAACSEIPAKIIETMLLTGITKKEALSARWEDYDEHAATLEVHGYNSKKRKILLSPKVRNLLNSLKKPNSSPWIFPSHEPGRHYSDIFPFWNKFRRKCGLANLRLHDLCHNHRNWQKLGSGYSPVLESKLENNKEQNLEPCNDYANGVNIEQVAVIGMALKKNINPQGLRKDVQNPLLGVGNSMATELKAMAANAIVDSGLTSRYLKKKRGSVIIGMDNDILNQFNIEQMISNLKYAGNQGWTTNPAYALKKEYNLTGPAMVIDSRESSLWYAIRQASLQINQEDADIIFAGGFEDGKNGKDKIIALMLLLMPLSVAKKSKIKIKSIVNCVVNNNLNKECLKGGNLDPYNQIYYEKADDMVFFVNKLNNTNL